VKIEKLLELINKPKSRFRLAPDGRLSFSPKNHEWEILVSEVEELLYSIHEPAVKMAPSSVPLHDSAM
jgi:hypothetical protein